MTFACICAHAARTFHICFGFYFILLNHKFFCCFYRAECTQQIVFHPPYKSLSLPLCCPFYLLDGNNDVIKMVNTYFKEFTQNTHTKNNNNTCCVRVFVPFPFECHSHEWANCQISIFPLVLLLLGYIVVVAAFINSNLLFPCRFCEAVYCYNWFSTILFRMNSFMCRAVQWQG